MRNEYDRHVAALAKETNTNAEAVELVTGEIAARLVAAARRAATNAPEVCVRDWLDMAMACNAAPNDHARAIIEHKARKSLEA